MSMRTVEISVTQEDIDRGKREAPQGCPVFRAVRRQVRRKYHTAVQATARGSGHGVVISELHGSPVFYWLGLPPMVTKRIRGYDDGGAMEPFSFPFDLPEECLR